MLHMNLRFCKEARFFSRARSPLYFGKSEKVRNEKTSFKEHRFTMVPKETGPFVRCADSDVLESLVLP